MRATLFILVTSSFLAALVALGDEDGVCNKKDFLCFPHPACTGRLNPLSAKDDGQVDPLCSGVVSPQPISTATSSSTVPPFQRSGKTNAENGGSAGDVFKLQTFPGLNQREAQAGQNLHLPPDTTLAVSRRKVLEVVNHAIALFDRDGSNGSHVSLQAFFGGQQANTGGIFDPKAYYDPLSERMFVVALELNAQKRQSWLYLAVSRNSDPSSLDADHWCTYRMAGAFCEAGGAFCDTLADRAGLGMSYQWVAVTTNQVTFDVKSFVPYVLLRVIDKKKLIDNADACPSGPTFIFQILGDPRDLSLPYIEPAKSLDETGSLYLLSNKGMKSRGSGDYYLWEVITLPSKTDPSLRMRELSDTNRLSYYHGPCRGQIIMQKGDKEEGLRGGYANIQQVIQRDGILWASHTSFNCDEISGCRGRRICARVVSIDVRNGYENAVVGWVSNVIDSGNDTDDASQWIPSVAINKSDDLMLVYQESSAEEFLGTGFATCRIDADDTCSSWHFGKLQKGECTLATPEVEGLKNRTGDYVAAQIDPLDRRSFWIAGEHTVVGSSGKCEWSTRIGYFSSQDGAGRP